MDQVQRFSFLHAPIRGHWIRLRDVLVEVCEHHEYPPVVKNLLSEMLAAVAMIADGIKFSGAVSLQSRGGGPLITSVAECRDRHLLRATATLREGVELAENAELGALMGNGQLAITLLPEFNSGAETQPYQGTVGIVRNDLAGNLEDYFAASEQLPTRFFLATDSASVTGLLLQRLPHPDDATEMALEEHEGLWQEISLLANTVSREELARLQVDTLLQRAFGAHTLTVYPPRTLSFGCTCDAERSARTLRALPRSELLELLETEGSITVTCEFCGQRYVYDQIDTHILLEPQQPQIH